jgi:hypothetical protein
MNSKYYGIGILVVSSFLFGCNDVNKKVIKFKKDIPDSMEYSYNIHKMEVQNLNLTNIENGTDSLEIRIWYRNELFIGVDYILIVSIKQNHTNGFIYRYWRKDFGLIDSFKVKNVLPKSSWYNFFKKIEKERIYELPSADKIPNFKYRHTDGYSWFIEIAMKSSYSEYSYSNPEIYAKEFPECEQMNRIAKILWEEFEYVRNPELRSIK